MERTGVTGGKRARGRPAKFDRAQAIRQAMELLWTQGFPATSARDLAGAMQIEPSSFYNSFSDRESVFREALSLYASEQPDAVLEGIKPGSPVIPVFWNMFHEVCRVRTADPEARGCLIVNSIAGLVGAEPTLGEEVADAARDRIARIEKLLVQAEKQREISPLDDRRAVAEALFAFLCGVNLIAKVIRSEKALWRMCQQVLTGLQLVPR